MGFYQTLEKGFLIDISILQVLSRMAPGINIRQES